MKKTTFLLLIVLLTSIKTSYCLNITVNLFAVNNFDETVSMYRETYDSVQKSVTGVAPEEAASIDSAEAQNFGLYPVELGQYNIFISPTGNSRIIKMAAYTVSDTINGGAGSGYAWTIDLNPGDSIFLMDSLPNLCINIFNLEAIPNTEAYRDSVDNQWLTCGYIPTIIKSNKQTDIGFYPNPTNGTVKIKSNQKILSLEIYDMSGRKVYSTKALPANNPVALNLGNLPKGKYIFSLTRQGNRTLKKETSVVVLK